MYVYYGIFRLISASQLPSKIKYKIRMAASGYVYQYKYYGGTASHWMTEKVYESNNKQLYPREYKDQYGGQPGKY